MLALNIRKTGHSKLGSTLFIIPSQNLDTSYVVKKTCSNFSISMVMRQGIRILRVSIQSCLTCVLQFHYIWILVCMCMYSVLLYMCKIIGLVL